MKCLTKTLVTWGLKVKLICYMLEQDVSSFSSSLCVSPGSVALWIQARLLSCARESYSCVKIWWRSSGVAEGAETSRGQTKIQTHSCTACSNSPWAAHKRHTHSTHKHTHTHTHTHTHWVIRYSPLLWCIWSESHEVSHSSPCSVMRGAGLDCLQLNVTSCAVNIYWALSHFIYLYVHFHIFNTTTVKKWETDRFMLKVMRKHAHIFWPYVPCRRMLLFFWSLSRCSLGRAVSWQQESLWISTQGKENLEMQTGTYCKSQVCREYCKTVWAALGKHEKCLVFQLLHFTLLFVKRQLTNPILTSYGAYFKVHSTSSGCVQVQFAIQTVHNVGAKWGARHKGD